MAPSGRIYVKFDFVACMKICQEIPNLLKIKGKKPGTIHDDQSMFCCCQQYYMP
jgi:hypothetical protein